MLITKPISANKLTTMFSFIEEIILHDGSLKERFLRAFTSSFIQEEIFLNIPPAAADHFRDVGQCIFKSDILIGRMADLDLDQLEKNVAGLSDAAMFDVVKSILDAIKIIEAAALAGGYEDRA